MSSKGTTRGLRMPSSFRGYPLNRRTTLFVLLSVYMIYSLLLHIRVSSPEHELFGDIPFAHPDEQDPARGTWEYIEENNEAQRHRPHRASWGALRQQGARAYFRDALRPDMKYLLTEAAWGLSNQFMEACNLVYLAMLTDRVAIIPPLDVIPHHIKGDQKTFRIPFSAVFDLPSLAESLQSPIVETHELKLDRSLAEWQRNSKYDEEVQQMNTTSQRALRRGVVLEPEVPEDEHLGCYSFTKTADRDFFPLFSMDLVAGDFLALPPSICLEGDCDRPSIVQLAGIIEKDPQTFVSDHQAMGFDMPSVLPESHVACVDLVFHFMQNPTQYNLITDELIDGVGVWPEVGKHMKFQPGLTKLADQYLRHSMGLSAKATIPPYLAVHIRRGDMIQARPWWADKTAHEWLYAASLLLEDIKKQKGVTIKEVVLATDEDDVEWLAPLVDASWTFLNHTHSDTAHRLGSEWFPMLIDTVILSGGHGFLGMPDSTMAALAYRRVLDWQGGMGHLVEEHVDVPKDWKWQLPL